MSTREPDDTAPVRPIDRLLAFMSLGLAVLSIGCFFAIIIGTATGMGQEDFTHGAWPIVSMVPLFGLPLAFLLIIALLIMSFVRRARAAKGS